MINVILIDDHQILLDGIKALLKSEEEINVVGEATNGEELIELITTTPVDVVLLDIHMPGKDGFEITSFLKAHHPDVKVIVLSMLNNDNYVHKIIAAGAEGYILKSAGKEELCSAIKLVARGVRFICADIAIDLLKRTQALEFSAVRAPRENKEYKELSKREIEVLSLIAEGYTNAEIANKLFTSKRTIETHRQNLLDKTQSRNTACLIKYALQNGIIV